MRDQGAASVDTATTYAQLSHAQRLDLRARLLDETLRDMGVGAGRRALLDLYAQSE